VMWSAKGHLAQVWRIVRGREKAPSDENELLPYRMAVAGAALGFVALLAITVKAGVRPHIALAFFTVYFLAIVVMTRIYAQIAVPIYELSFFNTTSLVTAVGGSSALTARDATILGHFHWFNRTYRQHPMGHELESIYFAEKLGQPTRKMAWIIVLSIVVGIVVGLLTTLQLYYHRGAATAQVRGMQVGVGQEAWNQISLWTADPKPPQALTVGAMLVSTGIVFLIALARNAWFGFPLHPIGYVFACSYAMEYIWAVVLLTWAIKLIVVRYGGLRLYRRSLPLFFGIILGDAFTQVVWGLILSAIGHRGASPYLDMKW